MTHTILKSALAALIVSAPLAGAFAEPLTRPSPADVTYSQSLATGIDNMSTSAINSNRLGAADAVRQSPADASYEASVNTLQSGSSVTYDKLLKSQIKAAETGVINARQNGPVNEAEVARIHSQLDSIRQAAADQAGSLSEGSYQTLSNQLNAVNQGIYALTNG
ncbi:hypothetical protein [Mesorhizobium sp. CAU 1741]|uniref:hypothetical protein n=1 Tax=Mesorhizobium sp. CAU 1741 TaxID=3140366 RepID=UPI00325B99A2